MNRLRHHPFYLLRQALLNSLRHLALADRVADLARLLVRACVVQCVGDLLLNVCGDFLLDFAGQLRVGGVRGL